jgi:Na+-driven multidrug efflux pump
MALVLVFVRSLGLGMIGAAWAGLICYGLAAALRIVFLLRLAPQTRAILLTGLWRMAIAVVLIGLPGSVLMWRGRYAVIAVVPVFAGVALAGWLSESKFRASVLQHAHAG